jgi:acyl-CoA thioesterase I
MKPEWGKFVTGLFTATLALRPTVIIAAAFILLPWPMNCNVRADEKVVKIVAMGDFLTSGYWLPVGHAFPDKLQFALIAKGQLVTVVNAGVSTNSAALLDWIELSPMIPMRSFWNSVRWT